MTPREVLRGGGVAPPPLPAPSRAKGHTHSLSTCGFVPDDRWRFPVARSEGWRTATPATPQPRSCNPPERTTMSDPPTGPTPETTPALVNTDSGETTPATQDARHRGVAPRTRHTGRGTPSPDRRPTTRRGVLVSAASTSSASARPQDVHHPRRQVRGRGRRGAAGPALGAGGVRPCAEAPPPIAAASRGCPRPAPRTNPTGGPVPAAEPRQPPPHTRARATPPEPSWFWAQRYRSGEQPRARGRSGRRINPTAHDQQWRRGRTDAEQRRRRHSRARLQLLARADAHGAHAVARAWRALSVWRSSWRLRSELSVRSDSAADVLEGRGQLGRQAAVLGPSHSACGQRTARRAARVPRIPIGPRHLQFEPR